MLRSWNLPGLARMLAVCSLAALLLTVFLLISLAVSAQSVTQHPAPTPVRVAGAPIQPVPVAPFRPIVVDLGVACVGQSGAYAVNAGGMVAGQCDFDGSFRGTLWQNNAWAYPRPLAGRLGTAYALNDAGLAAGRSAITGTAWAGEAWHAVVWAQGVVSDLGTLGGGGSAALDINNHGAVVGTSVLSDNVNSAAFLWEHGVMTPLAGVRSIASAINDHGQIVGDIATSDYTTQALLWDMGVVTELATLGGRSSGAYDINNLGQAVGYSSRADGMHDHAVLWANGVVTDLGDLGGGYSTAYGINDLGQVVGDSAPPSGPPWEDYCHAEDINAAGIVVGYCYSSAGPRAVAWDLWDNSSHFLPALGRQAP